MELQLIQNKIHEIRGQRVMIDFDLAEMYQVETKTLKQAVKRNASRFPSDFMFEISLKEWQSLRSQIVTSNRGGIRYMPYAFTEQGVAMLSSVLRSEKAIEINIQIVRAFILIRQNTLLFSDLNQKLENVFTPIFALPAFDPSTLRQAQGPVSKIQPFDKLRDRNLQSKIEPFDRLRGRFPNLKSKIFYASRRLPFSLLSPSLCRLPNSACSGRRGDLSVLPG